MIKFEKFIGPHGIPAYHQHLPLVESVAIHWFIFSGAADDAQVGAEGAYHWFEHVPFRGTVDFPDSMAIKGPFPRRGGNVGADTSYSRTCFWANVHESQAKLALRVITDLGDYMPTYIQKQFQNHIRMRGIHPYNEFNRKLSKYTSKMLDESLLIPPEKCKISADLAIYDDKIGYMSSENGGTAVIIESKEMADVMKNVFDLAWEEAKRLSKKTSKSSN